MIRGGESRANGDVLPSLQAGNRHQLTVDSTGAFQVIVAPHKDPPPTDLARPNKSKKLVASQALHSQQQSLRLDDSHSIVPGRAKRKITPLFSELRLDNGTDRDIIEGIRADLRAKFAVSMGHRPPSLREAGGQSSTDIPEITVKVEKQSQDAAEESSKFQSSASAPDVGQTKPPDDASQVHTSWQGRDCASTDTQDSRGADQAVITAFVSTISPQTEQQRTSSRLSSPSKAKKRHATTRGSLSRPPTQWLAGNPVSPPASSTLFRHADYNLPPINHGLTTIPSRQAARHSVPSTHRPRLKPATPYTATQSRQSHRPAKQEPQVQQEYVSIVGKVSMTEKIYNVEKRDGLLWVPCPRCQHRGTRCSSCTVIRVGGGYIILEGGQDLSSYQRAHLQRHHPEFTGDDGEPKTQSRPGTGYKAGWKRAGESDLEEDEINGRASSMMRGGVDDVILEVEDGQEEGEGSQESVGGGDGGDGRHSNTPLRSQSRQKSARTMGTPGDRNDSSGRSAYTGSPGNHQTRPPSARRDDSRSGGRVPSAKSSGRNSRLSDNGGDEGNNGGVHILVEDNEEPKDTGKEEGDGGTAQQAGGGGRSRTIRQRLKEKEAASGGFHSARGGRQSKSPTGGDSGFLDPGSRSTSQAQNRLKSAPPTPRAEDTIRRAKKKGLAADVLGESEEEEEDGDFDPATRHKLRKFKYKREPKDSMGAKACDWKDLQGIDPLDYLAKYCIVDQERIPTYERIFHNVDLDEDDEISLDQLDFALKAVNNQLISDPEMEFVHHVLELSHRPKLNFKLYCLVAALSERVVMLDDMVKKLVNKMDFEALEVKMKKVKELFYLLADMEHRGGVVTTGNLAIELTAGGLTPEHVKLVVNHLNREKKGLVEFLDYLTYVPLFMEIHGSIVSNPLDQNRDK